MSANKRRGEGAGESTVDISAAPPAIAPPKASRWQLVTSSLLVAVWIIFLAWMAFTG